MILERTVMNDFIRDVDLKWISGNNFLTALSPNLGHPGALEEL